MIVLPEGTLLAIQNLTWGGARGFRERPAAPLFVPYYHDSDRGGGGGGPVETAAGAGVVGTAHAERGLAWFGAALAGHMLAGDQPALAFRTVEALLRRVEGLSSSAPFTVDVGGGGGGGGVVQLTGPMGNGTVEVGFEADFEAAVGPVGLAGELFGVLTGLTVDS